MIQQLNSAASKVDAALFLVPSGVEITPIFIGGIIEKRSDEEPPLVRGGGCGVATDGGVVVVFSPSTADAVPPLTAAVPSVTRSS